MPDVAPGQKALSAVPAVPLAAAASALVCLSALLAVLAGELAVPVVGAAVLLTLVTAVVVAVPRPRLVLAALLVVVVARIGDVAGAAGIPHAYLAVLVLASVSAAFGLRHGTLRYRASPVYVFALLLVAAQAASVPGAYDPVVAAGAVQETVEALVFLVVVVVLCSATGALRTAAVTLVVTGALLAGLSVLQELVLHNSSDLGGLARVGGGDLGGATGRHSGPHEDANIWGRNLVLLLPFAFALHQAARRRIERAGWGLATLLVLGGIYLSQSRGALLACGVALAGWVLLAARRRRRAAAWLVAVACCALLLPGVGSRLLTLTDVAAAPTGGGDPSLVGRVTAFEHGTAMFRDNPLVGVGAGNFVLADADYRMRIPTDYPKPLAAHNWYLQMLAETGVVGALAWLGFLAAAGRAAVRSALWSRRQDAPRGQPRLAAAALVGLAAWCSASVFLHLAELRVLLAVVAVAVAAEAGLRSRPGRLQPVPAAPDHRRPLGPLLVALAVAAGTLAGSSLVAQVVTSQWRASLGGRVVLAGGPGEVDAYAHDVAGRPFLTATYAVLATDVIERRRTHGLRDVTVTSAANASVVTVGSTSASAGAAVASTRTAFDGAAAQIRSLPGLYVLEPVRAQPSVQRVRVVDRAGLVLALAVAACSGAFTYQVARRRQRQAA